MHDPNRVQELLEQALDSGMTPEQVCGGDAEMLAEVQARWEQCRRLEARLADFFPPNDRTVDASDSSPEARERSKAEDQADRLPAIPGYEVEAVLGRGGMGIVYRTRHLKLGRQVALKMLLGGDCAGRVERARFLREARAVAALQHPHVVQVYDVGEHESRLYFAMELVEGGSLAQSIASVPQAPEKAAAIVEAVAGAIDSAHRAGIIHRDIKPANVLLTIDGVPKVGDFGLALHFGDAEDYSLTRSGTRIGTPSYMAPEQASSRAGTVGPATDIYSLGAVLYEMLTGRPPFRGGTASETERQLLTDDPVPPSRLRAKVPRDLETICLKCLEKDPARRYTTAAALASDLARFRRGEPIAARPIGRIARAIKWARRRPAAATALATGTCAAALLLAVVLWVVTNRAATARAVNADLDEAVADQESAQWAKANAALERARLRLGSGGSKDLRDRLLLVSRDAELVARLDAIRVSHEFNVGDIVKFKDAASDYDAVFQQFGFGAAGLRTAAVGAQVAKSHIHRALIDALYDWMVSDPDGKKVERIYDVAQAADDDRTGWRAKALGRGVHLTQSDVDALANDPAIDQQPISLQLVVAKAAISDKLDPWPLLQRTVRSHPDDFWVNVALGQEKYNTEDYREALRYFQVAMALRPDSGLGRFYVGLALAASGRPKDAIEEYRGALRAGGDSTVIRINLAAACSMAGRHQEACNEFDLARNYLEQNQDPHAARYDGAYAYSLMMMGRDADSIHWALRACSIEPWLAVGPTPPHAVLLHSQNWDAILAAWHTYLKGEVGSREEAWRGCAEFAAFAGNLSEYHWACREQLKRFGHVEDPIVCEGIARACLLVDPSEDVQSAAAGMIDRTLVGEQQQRTWRYPYFMFCKGLAELRAGRAESALAIVEGPSTRVLEPASKLVAAMAHAKLGQTNAALASLVAGEFAFDWSPYKADSREAWMYHVLRREAERAILPELPRLLSGEYEPHDDTERLAMCGECQFRDLHATRARLLRQVISAHPELAVQLRGFAFIAAALAGCGDGKEKPILNENEREVWRSQARTWFREELAVAESTDAKETKQAIKAKTAIISWLATPELECVRDPAALSRMSAAEQQEWTALWQEARKLVPVAQH